jgi:hypothetical protein
MSFINKLPLTTFTLPTGQVIETKNLLKTIIISENTKQDNTVIKIKNGVNTPKLENLSFQLYGDRKSLYWLTTHLNDIDAFDKMPLPSSRFESNIPARFPGKAFYIYEGKTISNVEPGQLMVLYTDTSDSPNPNTWKIAGVIKEFDLKFRRIIIEVEIENTQNPDGLAEFPDLYILRDNDIPIVQGEYQIGRVENEYEKINSIYDTGLNGVELSPYRKIIDGSLSNEYDFSDSPDTSTILYKISTNSMDDINTFYYDTLEKQEIRKNTRNNSIKYISNDLAYQATSFINNLLSSTFKRGQKIFIEGQ